MRKSDKFPNKLTEFRKKQSLHIKAKLSAFSASRISGILFVFFGIFCKFGETLIQLYYGNISILAGPGGIAAGIGTCRILLPANEAGK